MATSMQGLVAASLPVRTSILTSSTLSCLPSSFSPSPSTARCCPPGCFSGRHSSSSSCSTGRSWLPSSLRWSRATTRAASNDDQYGVQQGDQQQQQQHLDDLEGLDPYTLLGLDGMADEDVTQEKIKAAFRTKLKEYHPDVYRGADSTLIAARMIRAYELLMDDTQRARLSRRRKGISVFDEPETEATQVFVNELRCLGRVGQCPQLCIHWVTPEQRQLLEEELQRAVNGWASPDEVGVVLDMYLARAKYQNNRYQPPKRKAKSSGQYVDWY
eukprot:jgi/Chlat1/812/Chrsp104S01312